MSEYRHVGRLARHGLDGMGWLGDTDVYVKVEDYDTHVDYSADEFVVYAENNRLRAQLDEALVALWRIRMAAERSSMKDPMWVLPNEVILLALRGMGENKHYAQERASELIKEEK